MSVKGIYFNILFIVAVGIFSSCSKIKKATDVFTQPTAREKYKKEYKDSPELFSLWNSQVEKALNDSIFIDLPYTETGKFFPRSFLVYSYEVDLKAGEKLHIETITDSAKSAVFLDVYRKKNDTLPVYKKVESAAFGKSALNKEIEKSGTYRILLQPGLEANNAFQLKIYTSPVYTFPVASAGNKNVQSFWGAIRDDGRRSHEGIDIFAPRGTPAIAVTKGRVTRTANRGLGGKQVWLRDRERGNSLYYAHLDSIIAREGEILSPGDTIGLVGNTGNARTTPPHLHFGIYQAYRGAINPLPFIYRTQKPEKTEAKHKFSTSLITKATANLRGSPTTNSSVRNQAEKGDTLIFLGRTKNWLHVKKNGNTFFIHESLASPEKNSEIQP